MAGNWMTLQPFVALPYRFSPAASRPNVEVMNEDGDIFLATIEDVGPWMTDDDYWAKGTRPIAEQCYASKTPIPSGPQKGRVPSNPGRHRSVALAGQGAGDRRHGPGVLAAGDVVAPPGQWVQPQRSLPARFDGCSGLADLPQ